MSLNSPSTKVGIAALCLTLCACVSFAEEKKVYQFPTQNVTATRYTFDTSKTSTWLESFNQDMLSETGINTLAQGIPLLPGVNLSNSAGITSAIIRGVPAEHNLFLFDGIPLTDPASPKSGPYIEGIIWDGIERIDLAPGSQSAHYGENSGGGVIQLFPRKDTSFFSVKVGDSKRVYTGSFSSGIGEGNVTLRYSRLSDSSLSVLRGTSDKNLTEYTNYYASFSHPIPFGKLDLSHLRIDTFTTLDYGFFDTDKTSSQLEDHDSFSYSNRDITRVKTTFVPFGPDHEIQISYTASNLTRKSLNATDNIHPLVSSDALYSSHTDQFEYLSSHKLTSFYLAQVGLSHTTDSVWFRDSETYDNTYYPKSYDILNLTTRSKLSYFFSQTLDTPFATFQATLRHDHYQAATSNQETKQAFSYHLGVAKPIKELDLLLKANFSEGFRAPSLFELTKKEANKAMVEENTLSKDIGFEKRWGFGSLSFTAYENQINNLLQYTPLSTSNYTYRNLPGLTRIVGFTYSLKFTQIPCLDYLIFSQTSQRAKTADGADLDRTPNDFQSLILGTHIEKLDIGMSVLNVGTRKDSGSILGRYMLFNLNLNYNWTSTFMTTCSVQNLTNTFYEESTGYNTPQRNIQIGCTYLY